MSKREENKTAKHLIMGIDFGSKNAGTTAIAWLNKKGLLEYKQSSKNQNADAFILEHIAALKIELVGIDAPLSIPKGLLDLKNNLDCFYRESDRKLGAMSPLFLGGLTARAIALKKTLMKQSVAVHETYPAAFIKHKQLKAFYNKKAANQIAAFNLSAHHLIPFDLPQTSSWHVIDACICLTIALLINEDKAQFVGDIDERIWF